MQIAIKLGPIWMSLPKILLMNDTDVDGQHFGCQRVMSIIRRNISDRGGNIIGSVKVGMPWQQMPDARAILEAADLLVINGEGTLHHNKKRGKWLLEAANFAAAHGAKVALINALWQENGKDWAALAAPIDYIACRDSRSARTLGHAIGRDVPWMGDLSMCGGPIYEDVPRDGGVVVGCSVHAKITAQLAALSVQLGETAQIVPVTPALKFIAPQLTGWRKSLKTMRAKVMHQKFVRRYPDVQFLQDELAYIARIKQADLSVTGRFHAVCLAVSTMTPFVSVASNSWKIEALLDDIGLSQDRIVPISDLTPALITGRDWGFSDAEVTHIREEIAAWETAAQIMFDDVMALI